MKRSNRCPKCASTDLIVDARVIDRGHLNAQRDLMVSTYRHPDALLFKGQQSSNVSAWVCAECGYLEFYADTPGHLRPES